MDRRSNRAFSKIKKYCEDCGLEVKTSTKARGHQGVFLHNYRELRRIDISKDLPQDKFLQVISHEFAHYFHHLLDNEFESLQEIFGIKEEVLVPELEAVTSFLAADSVMEKLESEVEKIKSEIVSLETVIKKTYPHFLRSKKFTEFERYVKNSPARFLVKYDNVKVVEAFKIVLYSVVDVESQFPEMPEPFVAYIKLRALMRRQRRYSSRKRKVGNYYSKSSELFARFVECWVVNQEKLKELAPFTYTAFEERIEYRSFRVLKDFLDLVREVEIELKLTE